jgi:transmembrane sensor
MQQQNNNWDMKELARKWQEGTITEKEKILFNQWYHSFDDIALRDITPESPEQLKTRLYEAIIQREQIIPERTWFRKYNTYISSAAAALALIFSIAGYFYFSGNSTQRKDQSAVLIKNKILPGENKAVLTLSDGSSVILDQTTNGVLGSQGGVSITKSKDGKVTYETPKNEDSTGKSTAYNKIATPRGGQYQVNLADGTKVWLNAASSLRFPVSFNKDERVVELTGEAYFEVNPRPLAGKKQARIPFLVKTKYQVVEVLGTHFNVNAYEDELNTKTTLLKGSVKVVRLTSHDSALLKPGQQSVIDKDISISDVDASQSIEWQKGYFLFDNESVESIMRKISRWYNVEVEYRGNIRYKKFGGRISKFENISQILQVMEKTQAIRFHIEERRVIVMP